MEKSGVPYQRSSAHETPQKQAVSPQKDSDHFSKHPFSTGASLLLVSGRVPGKQVAISFHQLYS